MQSRDAHIIAIGARTPLGFTAETSAAAVRAGVSRVFEHPFIVDRKGEAVCIARDAEIDPDLMGPERLVMLARAAIHDLFAKIEPFAAWFPKLSLFLGLPGNRPGWTREYSFQVKHALLNEKSVFQISNVEIFPHGHASGLMAMQSSFEKICQQEIHLCIFGGVDSYLDAETLGWLERHRQLAAPGIRSGFIPGEGAGFCAVASSSLLQKIQHSSLARVISVSAAQEQHRIKTDTICLGEGLSKAIGEAVKPLRLPQEAIQGVICDINGERYRSEEWGFAMLRHSHAFVDPTTHEIPSTYWGDVGAASGPLFLSLAVCAGQRGYAKGPRYMLWASSESGERSAAVIEIPMKNQGVML